MLGNSDFGGAANSIRADSAYRRSGADLTDSKEPLLGGFRATAAETATADTDDFHTDTIEGRLRLVLPRHTFFETVSQSEAAAIASLVNAITGGGLPKPPSGVVATWTTAQGIWKVILANPNGAEDGVYNASITGPERTSWRRTNVTASTVLDALRLCGAISGE